MQKYKILLVDDHRMILDGTKALIAVMPLFEVSAEASSGAEALLHIRTASFDILITDFGLPDTTGLELIKVAREINPEMKVIVMSMHDEPAVVRQILQEKVDAYVLKNDTHASLRIALDEVTRGRQFYSSDISRLMAAALCRPRTENVLSPRETEILLLIVNDMSTKQIADKLFISERTVETHRKNILRKTGCNSAVGLVHFAQHNELI